MAQIKVRLFIYLFILLDKFIFVTRNRKKVNPPF